MSKNIFRRKIPSILAVLIIIVGIITTTFLVKTGTSLLTRAGPGSEPKNIQITNVSDTSFTAIYTTDNSVIGTITMGTNPNALDEIILDDRDQLSQVINKYQTHTISANNLKPNTKYYFLITSGSNTILNNGSPFEITTGPEIDSAPLSQGPITGKVINPDGTSPQDGIVLIKINDAEILSSFLKNDGNFTVPLSTLRNSALTNFYPLDASAKINIEIYSSSLKSQINVSADQISPIPLITLSKNYELSEKAQTQPIKSSRSASFRDLIFPTSSRPIR